MQVGVKMTSTLACLILTENNGNHNQTKRESIVFKPGLFIEPKNRGGSRFLRLGLGQIVMTL